MPALSETFSHWLALIAAVLLTSSGFISLAKDASGDPEKTSHQTSFYGAILIVVLVFATGWLVGYVSPFYAVLGAAVVGVVFPSLVCFVCWPQTWKAVCRMRYMGSLPKEKKLVQLSLLCFFVGSILLIMQAIIDLARH